MEYRQADPVSSSSVIYSKPALLTGAGVAACAAALAFFELRIRERNRQVIRTGDTSHSELKIGRTKGGKAAFIPFGRASEQLSDARSAP
jgi:hypothetical protein